MMNFIGKHLEYLMNILIKFLFILFLIIVGITMVILLPFSLINDFFNHQRDISYRK